MTKKVFLLAVLSALCVSAATLGGLGDMVAQASGFASAFRVIIYFILAIVGGFALLGVLTMGGEWGHAANLIAKVLIGAAAVTAFVTYILGGAPSVSGAII